MKIIIFLLYVFLSLIVTQSAKSHDNVLSFEEIATLFAWDFDKTEIRYEKISDGLYVMFGVGGNILASVGEDGTLIVDDQFPQMMPKVMAALGKLGSDEVEYAINTHWHFDHAEGNIALGKGATSIIAHRNSRKMMLDDHLINFGPMAYRQNAFPEHALADITFDNRMTIHFNGQKIELMHHGVAHTNGDAAVWFRDQNVIHMGDVFNNTGYPFIDVDNGGRLRGVIEFCQKVYDKIDRDTVVVPGHGGVADQAKLGRYVEILKILESRIQKLIDQGYDLDEIIARKPSAEFDTELNAPELGVPVFINRVYASMIAK